MKIKTRIAFVANDLVIGGVSKVLISLCNTLDAARYDVHLILLSDKTEMENILPLNTSVKRHLFNYEFLEDFTLKSYLKVAFIKQHNIKRASFIVHKILNLRLDILHFHTLPRQLFIGQLVKAEQPSLQLVFTDHLVRLSESNFNWYQKKLLEVAHRKFYKNYHIISVSDTVFQSVKKQKRNDRNYKLMLLENSINLPDYTRDKAFTNFVTNQFIYVSRMNHHKGQSTLIDAWIKLKNPQKGKLILVGPDESNGKFQEMAKGDPTIVFTGGTANVKEFINDSNFAVFPSQKEGLPIALLEKMAYELPIICSDIPELTSIISNNIEGVHFQLDNTDDLVSKLNFAIENKEIMIQMGKNARRKVEHICASNNPIQFHNKFYSQLHKNKYFIFNDKGTKK